MQQVYGGWMHHVVSQCLYCAPREFFISSIQRPSPQISKKQQQLKTIPTIVTEHPKLSDIGRDLRAVCIANTSCL